MFKHNNCPVCNKTEFKTFINCKDYTVSQERFQIVECTSCGFKFTNPIPAIEKLGDYYKSEDYISHSNTKQGVVSKLYHAVRNYTLRGKLKLISSYVSRGTVLDYGCGTGMFLKVCQDTGWKAYGMEPDSGARRIASEMGMVVCDGKDQLKAQLSNDNLDIITLWHVLEHVTDLDQTLNFFKSKLSSNGALIIAVPNYKSADAKHYGEFWAAYDVPRHLYHFEPKTITQLLDRFGFALERKLPMKFDSFYVSMLSEKYKTGSIRYLNAFFSGLKSNLSAGQDMNYSSLIYVFRHK